MSAPVLEERRVGGVPLLVARPAGARGPLPLVLWLHGFRSRKEDNRDELARLADAGLLAVGVDAVAHGARTPADVEARRAASAGGAYPVMLALAIATADDVPAVVRALVDEGLADAARVGVVGISMGAFAAYRAVRVAPGLRAAVAVLGSPEWPHPESPHHDAGAFHHVALLQVTAERDESVPPDAARRFHAALAAAHPAPAHVRYVELAGAPHLMDAAAWERAMDETRRWLVRHLAAEEPGERAS